MRLHRPSGQLSVSVSEWDAADDAGIKLADLWRGSSWHWRRVEDALEKRAANRASITLPSTRATAPREERQARETARASLLRSVNDRALVRIAQEDAARDATTALVSALPPPPPESTRNCSATQRTTERT